MRAGRWCTDVSPYLGELAESLGDARVQTIPLRYTKSRGDVSVQTIPLHNGWGCRTFQTAYHIHVIPLWGVWAPSTVVYRHMDAHSLRYHHRRFQIFRRASWKSRWCKSANNTTSQWLRLLNLSNCTSHPCHTYMRCLSTFNCIVYRHMDAHSLRYHHRHFPRFGRVSQKSRWCKSANHTTSQWLRLSNLLNCISHPFHNYMRCLSTFNCCV